VADFNERYTDAKMDTKLYDKLKLEADGILAILCWAAKWWYDLRQEGNGGLLIPERVKEQSKRFMDRGDPVARFINEVCRTGAEERGRAGDMYESYTHWHHRSDEEGDPLTKNKFASSLERKNFKKVRKETGQFYIGVALKNAMELAFSEGEEE
jgi:phage/plasmid-associated DNA primase